MGDSLKSENETSIVEFSQRKKDHIEISLRDDSQANTNQFSKIELLHNALPEINLEEVSLETQFLDQALESPFFISSMTLGHSDAASLNEIMMSAAQELGWMMGVGSQRRQLFDRDAALECESLRKKFPDVVLFGNIGLSQIIHSEASDIQKLVDSLQAQFMVVHTNPLQEALQNEGTPHFKGGLQALARLCEELSVPVVLKETGCGFSTKSLQSLKELPLAAVDVSGRGGTHWGRVETLRFKPDQRGYKVGQSFADWGISTLESLQNARKVQLNCEIWGSGGVRNGLQGAQLLALGAHKVGLAQPILKAALEGEMALIEKMKTFNQELRVAMSCTGLAQIDHLIGNEDVYRWK